MAVPSMTCTCFRLRLPQSPKDLMTSTSWLVLFQPNTLFDQWTPEIARWSDRSRGEFPLVACVSNAAGRNGVVLARDDRPPRFTLGQAVPAAVAANIAVAALPARSEFIVSTSQARSSSASHFACSGLSRTKRSSFFRRCCRERLISLSFERQRGPTSASPFSPCFGRLQCCHPKQHTLADRKSVSLKDIAGQPLIVPDRRSRPHSHDLTMKLFERAGLAQRIAEVADEKRTIINLVGAKPGVAIVPRWTSRMAIPGVRHVPLRIQQRGSLGRLPLSVAWLSDSRDLSRDAILAVLWAKLKVYARTA